MNRIFAVDYGDVRTGIAVSDATNTIPGETFVITEKSPKRLADTIAQQAAERGAGTIVLGYPRNMDGTLGPRAEKSEQFAEMLRARELEVVLWDERRTTIEAHGILSAAGKNGKKRKATVDAVAAALILEGYLGQLTRATTPPPAGGTPP